MEKKEMDKLVKKYQPLVKKTGEQLSRALKAAEEDVAKMYKVAQVHVEIQMKNLQKEKLYHEIGKYVAKELSKGSLTAENLDKFKKKIEKINCEGEKVKKKLNSISKKPKKKK
ncbi:MAG: hypothetical protein P9L90_00700 [Candidatus Aadella gelida]|nr:hypothetical protein [Candidatus Aadella gelida]